MRRAGIAALAGCALAGAADAATMIVRSAGPAARAYPPGKALADGARIVLGPTDSVTLLDAKGTRTLKGPGTFTPQSASAATGIGTTLGRLASSGGDRRVRIGAVRGATFGNPATAPNIWYANLASSATICVADPTGVVMWRPDSETAVASRITGAGRSETVTWIKGQNARPWPAKLPVKDGATYDVSWSDGKTATLQFAVVGAQASAGLQDMAGALIQRGCQRQLDQLIDTAAVQPAARPAG